MVADTSAYERQRPPDPWGPKALAPGTNGRQSVPRYYFTFSRSISAISSSDSRPGVGMSNFVIAKRKTA